MKTKDHVVTALDHIAEVIKMLSRVDYDNDAHAMRLLKMAGDHLGVARCNVNDAHAQLLHQGEQAPST